MIPDHLSLPQRVYAKIGDVNADNALICIGGVHGNEPAGILAVQQFAKHIHSDQIILNGAVYGLVGNMEALRQAKRYIHSDLNRMWTDRNVHRIAGELHHEAEEKELLELKHKIDDIIHHHKRVVILDFHTMSADGTPFVCFPDHHANRQIAYQLPVTNILNLTEMLRGTLLEYYGNQGIETICMEGGQHQEPSSIRNIESVIWILAKLTGMLPVSEHQRVERHWNQLNTLCAHYPHFVRVVYRHEVIDSQQFEMQPGYENLHKVRRGELLGHDIYGEITSELSGRIVLPKYQGVGNDGYFLAKEINPRWLRIRDRFRSN